MQCPGYNWYFNRICNTCFIQEDISESSQNQVNTFQDEIGSNQRQPSFIEGGNSGFGTTKEYNEGEVESKDPESN